MNAFFLLSSGFQGDSSVFGALRPADEDARNAFPSPDGSSRGSVRVRGSKYEGAIPSTSSARRSRRALLCHKIVETLHIFTVYCTQPAFVHLPFGVRPVYTEAICAFATGHKNGTQGRVTATRDTLRSLLRVRCNYKTCTPRNRAENGGGREIRDDMKELVCFARKTKLNGKVLTIPPINHRTRTNKSLN